MGAWCRSIANADSNIKSNNPFLSGGEQNIWDKASRSYDRPFRVGTIDNSLQLEATFAKVSYSELIGLASPSLPCRVALPSCPQIRLGLRSAGDRSGANPRAIAATRRLHCRFSLGGSAASRPSPFGAPWAKFRPFDRRVSLTAPVPRCLPPWRPRHRPCERGLARCLAYFGAWQTIASRRCLVSGVPRPPGPQFLAWPPASSARLVVFGRLANSDTRSHLGACSLPGLLWWQRAANTLCRFSQVCCTPGPQLLASVPLRLAASAPGSR